MDYIHIDNLSFSGKHGVYEKERHIEQEFAVSVRLGFDTQQAAKSDDLKDTLDYQQVKEIIRASIEGGSRYLVEKLAGEIATTLMQDSRVLCAEVTIKKVAVWDNGVPGVTVRRGTFV